MPLPFKPKEVEKALAEVMPRAEEPNAGWTEFEEVARCLRLLGRADEAGQWFLKAAEAAAAAAERANRPVHLVQAGNYCRLAGEPEVGIPYLERAIPLLAEKAAQFPTFWNECGHLADAHVLLGQDDQVGLWVAEYHKRLRSKKLRAPDLALFMVRARREQDPELAREVMSLSQSWIRGERSKPWWVGATISLFDWHEMAENLLAQLESAD